MVEYKVTDFSYSRVALVACAWHIMTFNEIWLYSINIFACKLIMLLTKFRLGLWNEKKDTFSWMNFHEQQK